MKLILAILLITLSGPVLAAPRGKNLTPEQRAEMATANSILRQMSDEWSSLFANENPLTFDLLQNTKSFPLVEYDKAGYLIFSSEYQFASKAAKLKMAEELPKDVTLVIFTESQNKEFIANLRADYEDLIAAERLKVVYVPNANRGFWVRDGVPVPVWRAPNPGDKKFTVVDARYYHGFEEDQLFADMFNGDLTKHDYYFEGGNFLTNSRGECIIVDNTYAQEIPDEIFMDHYGCKSVLRLPHIKGIGHVDESVKFIDDNTLVTDADDYGATLAAAGYSVKMLPRPNFEYESYVNSLIVNGVVFVPVFDQQGDEVALSVYRDLGLKVVPLNSIELSNWGAGSIHCITMTYPPVEFEELLEAIDAQPVD